MAQEDRNSLLSPETSLIASSNSLIGSRKFPAKWRRELACEALIYLPHFAAIGAQPYRDSMKFPVFSLLAGNLAKPERVCSGRPSGNPEPRKTDRIVRLNARCRAGSQTEMAVISGEFGRETAF